MSKVAYVMSPVRATSHCATTEDSASLALSVSVLDQLKQGAEKYDEFRRLYPFDVSMQRRTASVPSNGVIKRITSAKEKFRSESWEGTYKPGDIIQYQRGLFIVPTLFLSTLADSVFWDHHCFIVSGLEWYQGARVIRLEFSPSPDIHGPDWEGAAFIDSATSYLLRVNFQLANLRGMNAPRRLDGYITFTSPSPYVIMPDTTAAVWWLRDANGKGEWGQPDYAQMLYIQQLDYRKNKPLGYPAPKQ